MKVNFDVILIFFFLLFFFKQNSQVLSFAKAGLSIPSGVKLRLGRIGKAVIAPNCKFMSSTVNLHVSR